MRNSIRAGFAGREWLDSQGGRFTFQTKSGWRERDNHSGDINFPLKGAQFKGGSNHLEILDK